VEGVGRGERRKRTFPLLWQGSYYRLKRRCHDSRICNLNGADFQSRDELGETSDEVDAPYVCDESLHGCGQFTIGAVIDTITWMIIQTLDFQIIRTSRLDALS
jgi:hypothetical protein